MSSDKDRIAANNMRKLYMQRIIEIHNIAVKALTDENQIEALAIRFEDIEESYEYFKEQHNKVIQLLKDDTEYPKEDAVRKNLDDFYYKTKLIKSKLIPNIPIVAPSTSTSQNTATFGSNIKLPQLSIPIFEGDTYSWPTFYSLYTNLIHNNTQLTNVEKFEYLRTLVRREPFNLIKNILCDDLNYPIALQLLVDTYQDDRKIATFHWEAIVNAPLMKPNNAIQLKTLINTFTEHLEALKVLKFPTDQWCFILFNLLFQKIDQDSRTAFNTDHFRNTIPKYQDLLDFLNNRCRAIGYSQVQTITNINKPKLHNPISFIANNSKENTNSTISCKCCNENAQHYISQCPKFNGMSPGDRFNYAKSSHLCINCLRSSHTVKDCRSTFTCRNCKRKHHTLLHMNQQDWSSSRLPVSNNNNQNPTSDTSINSLTTTQTISQCVMLSTAVVNILDVNNKPNSIRIIIDTGSQANFITKNCARSLGLDILSKGTQILGVNKVKVPTLGSTHCSISPLNQSHPTLKFKALILNELCTNIPSEEIHISDWNFFNSLNLADKNFHIPATVDMLIGAELFPQILKNGQIKRQFGRPAALETIFGWILMGKIEQNEPIHPNINSLFSISSSLENTLKSFWELEACPNKIHVSNEDKKCEEIFRKTYTRTETGNFVVSLPFRHEYVNLGNTYSMALRRFLNLELKLIRSPSTYSLYKDFISEYLQLGYLSPVAPISNRNDVVYLPHHCIFRPEKSTTKLRVVFDASAKGTKGISLNDTLLTGQKLQNDLNVILLKFRLHPFVFTTDIKQMFLQIHVTDKHKEFQRILWRFSQDETLKEYRLNRVTFGVTSSPFLAIRSLQELSNLHKDIYPQASKVILQDTFVDDIITGANSIESCLTLQNQIIKIMRSAGFELRKWASNSTEILSNFPESHRQTPLTFDKELISVKILGLQWYPENDTFSYKYNAQDNPCTKRNILSDIARLFDPLGYLAPISFFAKFLMQKLWMSRVDWDEKPADSIQNIWLNFKNELKYLSDLSIPRYYFLENVQNCQLHGFCDASEKGYAAVVYFRLQDSVQQIKVALIMAKSKVAPIKTISIPRLELCATVLLAKLIKYLIESYSSVINIDQIFAYSDSKVALAWLSESPHKWLQFIANRVSYVQEIIPNVQWYYIKSQENPADCASRGLTPKDFMKNEHWFQGPTFLSLTEEFIHSNYHNSLQFKTTEEQKLHALNVNVETSILYELLEKFSSLMKIKRIVAYILRFANRRSKSTPFKGDIHSIELQNALLILVKNVQSREFEHLITQINKRELLAKPYRKLSLFLDDKNLIRVGGRLRNASLPFNAKHPFLLPRNCRLTDLIIEEVHNSNLHPGLATMQFLIRQQFWILSGKRAVRHILNRCLKCFKLRPKSYTPYMGDLPKFRISQLKAFSHAAVDFAGPFFITMGKYRGAKKLKAYICIFVCCATKGMHIELVSDLTSEAFIGAFKRFTSRRGQCTNLYSDNGTNFVGASNQLRENFQKGCSALNLNWSFSPPASPHFNGLVEAGVKSVKTHLYRVIGTQILTYEELYTILVQIEALLNSRPLCEMSSDPNDISSLTPSHFLTIEPLNNTPDSEDLPKRINLTNRWNLIRQMHVEFWKRWHVEYLNTLQQRSKWLKPNPDIKLNTLVLLKDELKAPLRWNLGRIIELHTGGDGNTRVVTVKTENGCFKRSITKLCPLPFQTE